jgi:hypothetical protein
MKFYALVISASLYNYHHHWGICIIEGKSMVYPFINPSHDIATAGALKRKVGGRIDYF